jgi:Flp pilus assembly protein TadD
MSSVTAIERRNGAFADFQTGDLIGAGRLCLELLAKPDQTELLSDRAIALKALSRFDEANREL